MVQALSLRGFASSRPSTFRRVSPPSLATRLSACAQAVWRDRGRPAYNSAVFGTPVSGADIRFAAYLAIGAVSFVRWRHERAKAGSNEALHAGGWLLLGVLWVALAVFQYRGGIHEVTGYWRGQAYGEGWYSDRRPVQRLAIVFTAAVALVGAIAAGLLTPRQLRRYRLAYALSFVVGCFIVVRSVSLHSVDSHLGDELTAGLRLGDAAEILAALVVCAVVLCAPDSPRPDGPGARGSKPPPANTAP